MPWNPLLPLLAEMGNNNSLRHVRYVTAKLGQTLTSNTYTMTQDIKVLLVDDTDLYGRPAQLGK